MEHKDLLISWHRLFVTYLLLFLRTFTMKGKKPDTVLFRVVRCPVFKQYFSSLPCRYWGPRR